MHYVVRAACVYFFLMILFRIAGRRTVAQFTTFDLVLILIVSEALQGALIGTDTSLTAGFLVVTTLMGIDIGFSILKARFPRMERWVDGEPLIIMRDGVPLTDLLKWARVDLQDILLAAREQHGLCRIDQIRHAVLEVNGRISIIPK